MWTTFHLELDYGSWTCVIQCLDENFRHYCSTAVLSDLSVLLTSNINTVCMYVCHIPSTSTDDSNDVTVQHKSITPYRVHTEIWLWFSRLFNASCSLYVNKNSIKLTFKRWNFLYNVFFYSKYWTGLKFLNFELQMLCVANCEKMNKRTGNQRCNWHLHFPGQHYSFKDFSRLFHTYDHFQGFSRPWKFLH